LDNVGHLNSDVQLSPASPSRRAKDRPALMNNRLYTIAEAANTLGVSTKTLRRWDQRGRFVPTRTVGNQRRYTQEQIQKFKVQSSKFKVAQEVQQLFSEREAPKEFKATHALPSALSSLPSGSFLKSHFLLKHDAMESFEPVSFKGPPPLKLRNRMGPVRMGIMLVSLLLVFSLAGAFVLTKYNAVAGLSKFAAQVGVQAEETKNQLAKFIGNLTRLPLPGGEPIDSQDQISFVSPSLVGAVLAASDDSTLVLNINIPAFFSQSVGIGTTTPETSAILDLSSENKGFLPPRMTTAQRDAIESPAASLFVYNTITNQYNMYDGTSWKAVGGITAIGDVTTGEAFTATGTVGTALYFYDAEGRGKLTIDNLTATRTYTLPNTSGEVSLLGQTISNAELVNSKVTVNPGTNLTGGGDVALGSSITLTLKDSVALAGTLTVAGATTLTGTTTIATPFTLGAVSVTTTGTQLNYLNAATGTTGTTSTNLVFSTSPTLVTPVLGAATYTTLSGGNITDSGLTAGRVTFAGTGGLLSDDTDLTFSTDTLTATKFGATTLTGTIAGGGQQLNNIIIGTTTPLAGTFTTLVATTLDTGQGAYELYSMDQNVLTTSSPTFTDLTLTGGDLIASTATTFNLVNTTATTINFAGAATTALNIGNGNTAYTAINIGSGTGGNTINVAGTGATGADTINIGTGGTGADTITIGNNASTTSLAFTSGTGAQTHTSSVATGTTTTSANVFADTALTSGTLIYGTSSSLTSGILENLTLTGSSAVATAANSGSLLTLTSSTTGFTGATQRLAGIFSSGANTNASAVVQGLAISVTNTGTTNTNTALLLTASGGSTANNAIDITAGILKQSDATDSTSGSTGSINTAGGLGVTKDLAVDGGDIVTAATTFNLVNATATTVSFAGAATTLNIGTTDSVTRTINLGTGTGADTINIGTGATNANAVNIGTGAIANTIAIGSSSTTGLSLTDDNWSITSGGVANFVSVGATTAGSGAFTTLTSNNTTTIGNGSGITTTIGNSGGAATINITSGTGSQTHTSSVVSGTTTTSAFVFNGSALTSGTALYLTSTATSGKLADLNATNTSGTIVNLAYGAATTQGAGALTGLSLNLNTNVTAPAAGQDVTAITLQLPTASTTSNAAVYSGVNLSTAGAITNGTAGSFAWRGANIVLPVITQSAGGSVTASGVRVLVPASGAIVTAGTMNAIDIIGPTTSGPAAGTLTGVNIGTLTSAGSGTETAVSIGAGWDTDINATTSLEVGIGGTNEVVLNATDLSPATSDGSALGTTSLMWGDLFLASGAVINFNAGDVTITHAANALAFAGGTVSFDAAPTVGANAVYYATGTDVTLADGGTNASLTASNGGIVYSTATAMAILSGTATAGQLLQSGASAAPTWTTTTYPATNAVSTLLYASSANVMAALATANSGVLVTGGTGVPSISTDIPTAVTIGTAYIYRAGGTDVAVADGGTNCSVASITCFNNITGFSASGTTGTTSTNLVFSTSPALTTPTVVTSIVGGASFDAFNTVSTTINFAGAATTALNIGNGNTAYTAINIGSGTGGNTINIAGTGATGADTINIGTGGTGADTITIGNNASTSSLAFTSGTGSQTHTSSVVSGTTTTSAFVFADTALTSGTLIYGTSSSLTSGILANLTLTGSSAVATAANSGSLLTLTSTTTGFTGATQRLAGIYSSGANTNASAVVQGLAISVTNTGTTNTNTALLLTASGASTANNAIDITAGLLKQSDATDSTSGSTGSINTLGGVGITKALYVGTTLGIGAAPTATELIQANGTFTLSAGVDTHAIQTDLIANRITSAYTAQTYGYTSLVRVGASNTQAWSNATAGLIGFRSQLVTTAGGSGAVTGAASFYASNASISGATITNQYAYYVEALSGATNNYAFKSAGAGLVVIGDTTDSSSTTTGSFQTAGGLGVAKKTYLGDSLFNTKSAAADGSAYTYSEYNSGGAGAGMIVRHRIIGTGNTSGNYADWYFNRGGLDYASIQLEMENGDSRAGMIRFLTSPGSPNFLNVSRMTIGNTGSITMGLNSTSNTTIMDMGGTQTGTAICAQNGTDNQQVVDCTGALSDYAEFYPVETGTEYGEIVSTGDKLVEVNVTESDKDGSYLPATKRTIAQLVRSSKPYQQTIIGITSPNYSDFSSTGQGSVDPKDNPMPVALSGRVPVKVSSENGPIAVGDPITSSSVAGVGMKATKPGRVVGMALEAYSNADPTAVGKVMVFVNPHWQGNDKLLALDENGNLGIGITAPNAALDVAGDIQYTGTITDVSDQRLKENVLTISGADALNILSQLQAKSFNMLGKTKREYGFIAQEVQSIFPDAVSITDPANGYMGLSYLSFVPLATEAIKELDLKLSSQGNILASQGEALRSWEASSSAQVNYVLENDPIFNSLNNKVSSLESKLDLLSLQMQEQASTSAFLTEIINSQVLGASTSAALNLGDVELNNATISEDLMVLGRTTVTDLGVTGNINAGLLLIHGLDGEIGTLGGDLYLQKDGLGGVDILNGLIVIDTSGNMKIAGTITADSVEAKKYTVLGDQSIGSATIPTGETSIEISTGIATSSSKIFLTATSLTDKQITVVEKNNGSFKVAIPQPTTSPISFDWWIVGNK